MAPRVGRFLRRLRESTSGVALVEFAVAFPVLLLLYVGSYTLSDAIACNRKVTVTARTLTDLTTRYPSLTQADAANILNASAQVLSPYSVNNAIIGVSEVQVTDATHAKVIWSKAINAPGLTAGTSVIIPNNMSPTGTYLILGQVQYAYTPSIHYLNTGSINLADSILMLPRVSDQVPLT